MVEQRKRARGWAQRFIGPRVNCERVPCLPMVAVAWVLDDPRKVPYLMIWKDDYSNKVIEAVRVARCNEPIAQEIPWANVVEIKRTDGTRSWICTIQRPMPRREGVARLFICPRCQYLRRALYGWSLNPSRRCAVFVSRWQCRKCARLRYASEGGALVFHPRTAFGRYIEAVEGPSRNPPPEPWYPYVFANPKDAKPILRSVMNVRAD